jgi:amidase
MAGFPEYDLYDGLGLAALIESGEILAMEVCEEAIERIEKRNPAINAVVHPMYDIGRSQAKQSPNNLPFHGVPFLLKDLGMAYAGVPLSNGSKAFRNYIPDFDSDLVTRYKKTGVAILGKTSTPEFGLMGITEPDLFGPTKNPWNIQYTPGGSSGGSAAAVAAGMVPLASASDGGGSIRIPASCCGLFGLKPSRGRTPTGPNEGEKWQGAVVSHVISRSVRDSAAMLDLTHGMMPGARCIAPYPKKPYLDEIQKDPEKMKIGFSVVSPIDRDVDEECKKAVYKTARLLESLGHNVEEATPDLDGMKLALSYFTMYYGEVAAIVKKSRDILGKRPLQSDFEIATLTLAQLGKAYSAGEFVEGIAKPGAQPIHPDCKSNRPASHVCSHALDPRRITGRSSVYCAI